MIQEKTARKSYASSSHIVFPNETNVLGNLMGGQLLNWMDMTAGISAHRHSRRVVVTASVNNVSFQHSIALGDIVTLEAQVSRAFKSSMEVFIDVWVEHHRTGEQKKCNEANYIFVAVDQQGEPIEVPDLVPETEVEKQRHRDALQRRQLSLLLAGKIRPEEASEIKAMFS
ncbi:MAG: acyl-CoA thioesterase [Flavobacteriales bacterium]